MEEDGASVKERAARLSAGAICRCGRGGVGIALAKRRRDLRRILGEMVARMGMKHRSRAGACRSACARQCSFM
ncbi:hypothetical protein BE20_24630 [Sorangium cellulosum]|nr:hypothetical protein BE20_24630 [Sorangium cellulosum]